MNLRRLILGGALILAAVSSAPALARADLTVASQVDIDGLAPAAGVSTQSFPEAVTVYYKGDKARSEIAGDAVEIFDGSAGKVYTLDTAQKTFYVQTVKDAEDPPLTLVSAAEAPADANINFAKTEDVPGDTQVIVGRNARKYLISGDLQAKPPAQRGYSHGGHGGHRGGFPGGGFPGGGMPFGGGSSYGGGGYGGGGGGYGGEQSVPSAARFSPIQVDGEAWLSDSARLPSDKKASVFLSLAPALFFAGPLVGSLVGDISKTGEIPLYVKITLTQPATDSASQQAIVVTQQVQSISQSPLPDSLFAIPAGYQQVAAPPVVYSGGH